MARNDDEDERRKRRREREDELEKESQSSKGKVSKPGAPKISESSADLSFEDLVIKVNTQIDQVSALYNMFFSGAETLPPIERRAQLEATMQVLQSTPKPTPASNFRFNTALSRFNTYRDRWDKQLKGLEAGKIKRSPSKA